MNLATIIKKAYEQGWDDRSNATGEFSTLMRKDAKSTGYSETIISYIETDPSQLKMDLR